MLLSVEELRQLGLKVFCTAGVPEPVAACVTDALVLAELDGIGSHGFARIPFYADQARTGKVAVNAAPELATPAPTVVRVDARNNYAFPAISAGLEKAIPLCREYGTALVGITRSHHCGVLGHFVERIAEQGLMALGFANTPAAMAPWNGCKATFGTNPLAFGCPRKPHPLVLDMSLSKVARGKVMNARQKGQPIPEGWALDCDGKPTTDPARALGGTMIPFGDAKGAALALMVEILAATLNGANHAYEASSFFEAEGAAPGTGQTFILMDPTRLNPSFPATLEALCAHILGQEGTRLPGARRIQLRAQNTARGVELPDALYNDLCKRAEQPAR